MSTGIALPGAAVVGALVIARCMVQEGASDNGVTVLLDRADRYHASDPERFPRTSRDSYLIDPRSSCSLACTGGLDGKGEEIAVVWHSHWPPQPGSNPRGLGTAHAGFRYERKLLHNFTRSGYSRRCGGAVT